MLSGLSGGSARLALRIPPSITTWATWMPCGDSSRAMLLRQHALDRLLRDKKPGECTDRQRLLDLGRIEFDERPAGAVARIEHDDVGRPVSGVNAREELDHIAAFGGIARKRLAADLARQRRKIVNPPCG